MQSSVKVSSEPKQIIQDDWRKALEKPKFGEFID
jgi:hypothetical protein